MPLGANKSQSRISAALSSAFLEWIMLVLLLIHALYSYVVSAFAHVFKLQTPCPLCSQLDHVLGNKKSNTCVDLICERHKLEISALLKCSSRPADVDVPGLCTRFFASSTSQKLTYVAPRDPDCSQRVDEQCLSDEKGSLCFLEPKIFDSHAEASTNWMLSSSKKDSDEIPEECNAENVVLPPSATRDSDEFSEECNAENVVLLPRAKKDSDELPEECNAENVVLLHTEEVNYSSTVVDCGIKTAISTDGEMIKSNPLEGCTEEATSDGTAISSPEIISPSELDNAHHALAENENSQLCYLDDRGTANTRKPSELFCYKETDADTPNDSLDISSSRIVIPCESQVTSDDRAVAGDTESSDIRKPSKTSSNKENDADVTNYSLEMSESLAADVLSNVALQAGSDDLVPDGMSENLTEEKENPSQPGFESVPQISGNQCITEETCDPQVIITEDADTNDEHSTTDPGTSICAQMSLSEAYDLAISKRSKLPSATLTDMIVGKDSTVHEELRQLISHLSAARGIENPWNEIIPSPRAPERGDDIVVQNITQSLSIERNPSGLESLDSSIISEIEGESTVDRLKRQIELDRKSISLLCKELEEERNASAIAASQALAMITRLQEEKAAVQMEALQYQRMMEEQAEYDHQTLQKANETLDDCGQRLKEAEFELEEYRRRQENISDEFSTASADTELERIKPDLTDEKEYIRNRLQKLEQKLHSFSNNVSASTSVDKDAGSIEEPGEEYTVAAGTSAPDGLEHPGDPATPGNAGSDNGVRPTAKGNDLSAVQDELLDLERRLRTLEADHNFLEHSINSLRNGREGARLIQEIASSLRQLRDIGIQRQ